MDKSKISVSFDHSSGDYTIYCPATLRRGPMNYKISDVEIMKCSTKTGRVNWDLIQSIIDKHFLPPRRREAIEHTRRLGLS